MPRVDVALPGTAYPIHIGSGLLTRVGPLTAEGGLEGAAALVTHPELPPSFRETVLQSLTRAGFHVETVDVPQGEASKSLRAVETLYTRFAAMRLDRRGTVVALGGGVIGDLAGFAAATYLRGVALVQVPTTLLAQVDASVGGKTAVDLPCGKNLVGAFHQPRAVITDVDTLGTLPPLELRSGLAEVVKYGVIADAGLFASLERDAGPLIRGNPETLVRIVERSCLIKAEVVRQDPNEQGLRAILNYGHTVGHALEAVLGYGVIPHGAAVSLGMSAAAELAVRLGLFDPADADRQDALLRRLGLPTLTFRRQAADKFSEPVSPSVLSDDPSDRSDPSPRAPQPILPVPPLPPAARLLEAMALDKKTIGGRLRFVLPRALGTVEIREVQASQVAAVLEEGVLC